MPERIRITSLAGQPEITLPCLTSDERRDCQSGALQIQKDRIIIIRRPSPHYTNLQVEEETKKRAKSIGLFKKYVPDNVQRTDQVLLHGMGNYGENIALLGRFVPRLFNVKPSYQIPVREIISTPELSNEFAKINLGFLKMILREDIVPDLGRVGDSGNKLPLLRRITRPLTNANIMLGQELAGKQVVFCDPDWYMERVNGREQEFRKLKRETISVCLRNYIFYKTAALVGKSIDAIRNIRHKESLSMSVGD